MPEAAFLRCHCGELITNDEAGRRKLKAHYRAMLGLTGADQVIRDLETRNLELVRAILREQDRHGCGVRSVLTDQERKAGGEA